MDGNCPTVVATPPMTLGGDTLGLTPQSPFLGKKDGDFLDSGVVLSVGNSFLTI